MFKKIKKKKILIEIVTSGAKSNSNRPWREFFRDNQCHEDEITWWSWRDKKKMSKDDNDTTKKSFCTRRTCCQSVQVPENNYQWSMDEVKVIFIILSDESLRETHNCPSKTESCIVSAEIIG